MTRIPLPRHAIDQPDTSLKAAVGRLIERAIVAEQHAEALARQLRLRDARIESLRRNLEHAVQRVQRVRRRVRGDDGQGRLFE